MERKRQARAYRACDRLAQAAPANTELLRQAAERGHTQGALTAELMRLLMDRYGAAALQAALLETLALRRRLRHYAAPNVLVNDVVG